MRKSADDRIKAIFFHLRAVLGPKIFRRLRDRKAFEKCAQLAQLGFSQMRAQSVERQQITLRAKSRDLTNRNWCNVGVMSKRFARMDIAQMNLDARQLDGGEGIMQRHRCMRIRTSI